MNSGEIWRAAQNPCGKWSTIQQLDLRIRRATLAGSASNPKWIPLGRSINPLRKIDRQMNLYIKALVQYRGGTAPKSRILRVASNYLFNRKDIPLVGADIGLVFMNALERSYAGFSEVLLAKSLGPSLENEIEPTRRRRKPRSHVRTRVSMNPDTFASLKSFSPFAIYL